MLATSKYLTCIVEALKLHFIKYTNVLLNQIDVYIQKMSAIKKYFSITVNLQLIDIILMNFIIFCKGI